MTQSVTKTQVQSRLAANPSTANAVFALLHEFRSLVSSNASAVSKVLNTVKSGNWSAAKAAMSSIVQIPGFKSLSEMALKQGNGSIGLVTAVGGGLVVAGKGMKGVLTDVRTLSTHYSYEEVGLSVGMTEGMSLEAGLYVSTESPADAGGPEFFAEISGDLGIGAAAERFTSVSGGEGAILLVATGEKIEVSAGVGYAWVEKI